MATRADEAAGPVPPPSSADLRITAKERAQFSRPPQRFIDFLNRILANDVDENIVLENRGELDYAFEYDDASTLLEQPRPNKYYNVGPDTVAAYMKLICRRVNKGPGPEGDEVQVEGLSDIERDDDEELTSEDNSSSHLADHMTGVLGTGRSVENAAFERRLRCVATSVEFGYTFEQGGGPKAEDWHQEMQQLQLTDEQFQDLDYMFIPMCLYNQSHWVLGVLAVKQRFWSYTDPYRRDTKENADIIKNHAMRFLKAIILEKLTSPADQRPWHLLEPTGFEKSNRHWPSQFDAHNCGIFMLTNACCLAFGYSLLCYNQDDMVDKRWRIASELLRQGFRGAMAIETLPVPTRWSTWAVAGSMPRHMTRLTRQRPSWVEANEDEEYDESNEDDSEEDEDDGKESRPPLGSTTTTTTTTRTTDRLILIAPRLKSRKVIKGKGKVINRAPTHIDRVQFPKQFSPSHYTKDILIQERRAIDPLLFSDENDLEALEQICRKAKMTGWPFYSAWSIEVLRAWMEDVVLGSKRSREFYERAKL